MKKSNVGIKSGLSMKYDLLFSTEIVKNTTGIILLTLKIKIVTSPTTKTIHSVYKFIQIFVANSHKCQDEGDNSLQVSSS